MSSTQGTTVNKPLLFFTGTPTDGHLGPLSQIVKAMASRGYSMAFVTSTDCKSKVKVLDIHFLVTPSVHKLLPPDCLLYEAVLLYADVFVSNGGWDACVQSVLRGTPTPDQVCRGVEEVISSPRYERRALELMKANEEMDFLGTIEKQIAQFTL